MKISIIVAISENNVIGKDNGLLWKLSGDMQFFKRTTTGHHIVMGRKTFESLGKRLLPNRTSIVITRNNDYDMPEGGFVAHSVEEALSLVCNDDEIFCIGGEQIYKMMLPYANTIYITRVHHCFDGDACFPKIDLHVWQKTNEEHHFADEKNQYDYTFETWEKK